MPEVGFETTIPTIQRAKAPNSLGCVAIVLHKYASYIHYSSKGRKEIREASSYYKSFDSKFEAYIFCGHNFKHSSLGPRTHTHMISFRGDF
jgi:hypothetical protein